MATIFNFLQDIIAKKQGNLLDDVDNEVEFSPFMVQRWLSFYDTNYIKLLNDTTNRLYPIFEKKKDWYNTFLTVIPKTKFHKIAYVRKTKEKYTEDHQSVENVIKFIAHNTKISTRELEEYINDFNLDLTKYKKIL